MKKRTIIFGAVMAGTFFTNAKANTFGNLGSANDVRYNLSSETSTSASASSLEFTCSGDTSKMKEAKCGEAKCGDKKASQDTISKTMEAKCGEGKCGDKKATMSKTTEAKCGDKNGMTTTKKAKKVKKTK